MVLNMLSSAVKAKPVASMDFILTSDKSRLLFFSFSSSRSIFFLCCLSSESPRVSFRFSTVKVCVCVCRPAIRCCDKCLSLANCGVSTYISCFAFRFLSSNVGIYRYDKLEAMLNLNVIGIVFCISIFLLFIQSFWKIQLPSPKSAVHNDMKIINKVSDHILSI